MTLVTLSPKTVDPHLWTQIKSQAVLAEPICLFSVIAPECCVLRFPSAASLLAFVSDYIVIKCVGFVCAPLTL